MGNQTETRMVLEEGRFGRFEAIPWWDQSVLRDARVLVVGAGALGNEVIKNLALLGVGHLAVVDMDFVERTNLCRSVLFRQKDEGAAKAAVPKALRDRVAKPAAKAGGTRSAPSTPIPHWLQCSTGMPVTHESAAGSSSKLWMRCAGMWSASPSMPWMGSSISSTAGASTAAVAIAM